MSTLGKDKGKKPREDSSLEEGVWGLGERA
jgi:hypothetical protein